MRILEDGSNSDGKLLFAALALPQALLSLADALASAKHLDHLFFGFLFADDAASLTDYATVRANRTFRPAHLFEVLAGFILILKVRFEDRSGFAFSGLFGPLFHAPILLNRRRCVKCIIPKKVLDGCSLVAYNSTFR